MSCLILPRLVAVLFVFQVGAKCKVELPNETEMYTCHVQNISKDKNYCHVFVERIGKEIVVPLLFIWFSRPLQRNAKISIRNDYHIQQLVKFVKV